MGLVSGLGLLLIGLTGSLLMFREEIEAVVQPPPESSMGAIERAPRLGYDELFSRVRAQLPGREVLAWDTIMHDGAADAVAVSLPDNPRGWEWLRADPATGTLLPQSPPGWTARAFAWALELHYTLLLGRWGELFAGVLAVMLCLLGVSGIYLYRGFWRTLFTLRWRSSARIFFSDLHKMVGISSVAFNLILGFTGAWWNLQVVKRLFEEEAPSSAGSARVPAPYNTGLSIDAMVAEAVRQMPGLDPAQIYLSLPPRNESMRLIGSAVPQNPLVGNYNSTVHFDPQSGEVTSVLDFRRTSAWHQFEVMMGPLHFGTFGGLPVKVLWCVLGLSPGVLAWSGVVMYWKRRRSIRGKPGARRTPKAVDHGASTGSL
jgi:uncharacterized iron-regulated membrane protein